MKDDPAGWGSLDDHIARVVADPTLVAVYDQALAWWNRNLLSGYVGNEDPDPELTEDIAREIVRFWDEDETP